MTEVGLVTVAQAAERLGVAPIRVNQFIRQGRLPAKKIPGLINWWIEEADLEEFAKLPRTTGYPTGRPRQPRKPQA